MKKHIGQRILSLVLVLVMVLGMVPMNLAPKARAVTPEEQTVAEALLQKINTMETGERFSKYVRVTGFYAPNVKDYPTAKTTLKGLSGYYIVVNADPIEEGSDMHYALNAGKEVAYSNFAVDRVQMVGNQLFGADPKGALYIAYDATTSGQSKQEAYSDDLPYTTARARYTLKNREGKHFVISKTNSRVEMRTVGVTTTLYAKYTTGCVRFMVSSTYSATTEYEKLGMRFNTTGAVPFVDYGTDFPTFCYLYEEKANRVNVEPLYDAIVEAKAYINNCNPYEEEHYGAFLTALENALNAYPKYNVDSYSDNVATAESTVNDLAQALRDATSLIKPYDEQINELLIPATQRLTTLNQIQEGSYFILSLDRNGFYTTFDPASKGADSNSCKIFNKLIPVSVTGEQVEVTDLLGSESLYAIPSGGYSIQLSNGEYLQMTDNSQTGSKQDNAITGTPMSMTFVERADMLTYHENAHTDMNAAFLFRVTGDTIYLATSNGNNKMYAYRNTDATEKHGSDEYDKYLYRISDVTLELFKALEYVEPYAYGNTDGRYDATVYGSFAETLSEALEKYRENRSIMSDATLQQELDTLAEKLQDYARQLTLADSKASYIDIPVEILDFASDKLLFEYYAGSDGARFSMSGWATIREPAEEDTLLQPLVAEFISNVKQEAGTTTSKALQGLVGDRLVNDKPVYKDYVIGFIAAAILTEWMADSSDTHRTQWADQVTAYEAGLAGTQWQDAFWNILSSRYSDYKNGTAAQKKAALGSLQATLNDTDTKANGGKLPWSKVNTAYDLAYYILNNIWQPATEALPDGRSYNTVVPERDTLRLYYDESTELYTIDASNRMVYDGYTIYNTVPQIPRNQNKYPLMTPIDGLGFEKNNTETDPGTYRAEHEGWEPAYAKANMGYTLHASGSFIYYEDQEQYFDFVGDDDVYFFVNDRLVMDIGGAHSPTGFPLDLNQANKDLKLGLEDGGVYSFDMFYAERHTNGSNMKFSTNIKIVSSDTLTTKGQYAVEVKGNSTVGSDGKGGEMIDNQLLNVGDVVAYSFNLDNTRSAPVQNLEFHDPSLGVHLTKDKIEQYNVTLENGTKTLSLTNPNTGYGNGVATRFADLILEYIPYDEDGNRASGTPTELTPAQMATLIRETITLPNNSQKYDYGSLPTAVYRVRVSNESELKDLLAAGVPKKCYFSIYGFLRKTVSEDVPYVNELTTHCSYRRSANISAEFATITGKAARVLRVPEATEMPDVPRIEITLDYGKPVQIPLQDITNQIFFEKDSPASVGNIVGYMKGDYFNGKLLKDRPKELLELAVGDSVPGQQGAFTLREGSMEYAMWEFLETVERLYAVVALNDFILSSSGTQYEYVLVEIRIIPTNMMYYEAEDFTDSEISYVQVGGSYPNWKTETDYVDTEDNQDFNPVNHRTYDMVIDRDNIPAEAFFVDFDGKGYADRYRLQPQYKGSDFDTKGYWFQETHTSGEKLSIHTASGNAVLDTSREDSAADEHFIQTIEKPQEVSQQNGNTVPLHLIPGQGHMMQIRFRVENCTLSTTKALELVFRLSDDATNNVSSDETTKGLIRIPLNEEDVFGGNYVTVTYDMDNSPYYTAAQHIDSFRIIFSGMNGPAGRILVDYIYIGPEKGMDQDVYDEYLYFSFDNTASDVLRYTSGVYGSVVRNYDLAENWTAPTAGETLHITDDGYLVFSDQSDNEWNCAEAGIDVGEDPIRYKVRENDVYQIRFQITGTNVYPEAGETPLVALQFADGGKSAAYCQIDLEKIMNDEFHTLTMPMNTSFFKGQEELKRVRVDFSHILGDPTFTIDYVYIGPMSMADKVTQKADYLFFDFTNNDAAKSRYSNPAYGTIGKNFDTDGWHNNHTYTTPCLPTFNASAGTMSFKTTAAYYTGNPGAIPLATNSGHNFSENHFLNFVLTGNEYFKVRMKIEGATDTSANFIVRYADEPTSNNTNKLSSFNYPIPATAIQNGEFFTLEGYITFGNATKITALRFDVQNLNMSASTKPITLTYDYIYVGPAEKASVTTESLFFGFDNEEEDRVRYGSYVYGGWNYDDAYTYGNGDKGIGHWATSSEMNGSYHDYNINNKKGTLNLGVGAGHTGTEEEDWIYGPYLATTDRYGLYSMSAERKTLRYRPENADVVQVRFRVSNCQQGPGREPNVVFLFGGYDTAGNYVFYNDIVIMRKFYTLQEGYITVSIPTNQAFRDLAMVTNLGLRFQNIVNYKGEGLVEIDYIYVGPGEGAPYTYGYDSSYDTNSLYSDGNSLFTEGNGVRLDSNPNPAKYTETRFSFTGTGFDLISRTGADQGLIRVEIYTDPSYHKDYRLESASVNMKGELELYQIPVYSKHNLAYGTYYVSVMVNGGVNYPAIPALSRGDDFYLDAIRIYDPIDVSQGSSAAAGSNSAVAYAAYLADIEGHPVVKEVRDILLTAEQYTGGGVIQDGAVFVDYSTVEKVIHPTTGEDVTDPDLVGKVEKHLTSDIVTYKKIGPNNETYLGPQQLVAFQMLVFSGKIPNRIDIGAKTITADSAKLDVKVWGWDSDDIKTRERLIEQAYDQVILGPSHQYYSLYLDDDIFTSTTVDGKRCYRATIIIANPAEKIESTGTTDNSARNVLSITDVRVGFRQEVTVRDPGADGVKPSTKGNEVELPEDAFIRFVVTGGLKEDVELALKEMYNICDGEHIPGSWQTVSPAGIGQEGLEQLRCTRCGTVLEERILPAISAPAFAGASVALQSDLTIYYRVKESDLAETGFTDPYVVVYDNGTETVIRDYSVQDGSYSFAYRNIAPHRMGDTLTATLYATYNGQVYACQSKDYSVADYCYNMLGKTADNDAYATFRTLLVDLLLYGEMSQQYTRYRTDALCTARLTAQQRVMGTELTRELVNLRDRDHEVVEEPSVEWKGAGLNLRESVAIRFCMVADSYEDLEVRITLNGITESYTAEDFEHRADGIYIHFTKLNAAQMSEPIYIAAYRNGEQVSNTMCYSVESYAHAKANDTAYPYLAELVARMICYGDSARAYIGK